jgi:hypothetical protein
MAATTAPSESVKRITYLAAALKALLILEVASRLANQARDAGWTYEDYLAAVFEREVSARNASGAKLRIRAAGFSAIKTIEAFNRDTQSAIRTQVGALTSGAFLTEARNGVLLGPPGRAKLTSRPLWESWLPGWDIGCCSRPQPTGSLALLTRTGRASSPQSWRGCDVTA